MRLQVALDADLMASLNILRVVRQYIGIAEIGTPLIYREGMHAVRQIRAEFPKLTVLADLKIMDAGEEEASIAFEAGADIVTVLGVTQRSTLESVLKAARAFDKEVLVDTMQMADLPAQIPELIALGCHYICIHTAFDVQGSGETPLTGLKLLRGQFPDVPLAVAGGIGLDMIDEVIAHAPQIVIVGGAITRSSDPAAVAQQIQHRLNQHAPH
jgi:3-hexulose-6-phosphate synthase